MFTKQIHHLMMMLIAVLFFTFTTTTLSHYPSANASIRPNILSSKTISSQKVVIKYKSIAVKNLTFKNKNYYTYNYNYFTLHKGDKFTKTKLLTVRMPHSKKKMHLAYIKKGSKHGYVNVVDIKNVPSYSSSSDSDQDANETDSDNDDYNQSDTNDDSSTVNSTSNSSQDSSNNSSSTVNNNSQSPSNTSSSTSNSSSINNTGKSTSNNSQSTSNSNQGSSSSSSTRNTVKSTPVSSVTSDTKTTVSNTSVPTQAQLISEAQANIENKFETDQLTTPQELNSVAWEKFDDGSNYRLNLTNGRYIYYSFTDNDPYTQYWQEAIDAWNALGVVRFVPYTNENNVNIIKLGTSTDNTFPGYPSLSQTNWLGSTLRSKTSDDRVVAIVGYLNKVNMQKSNNDRENLITAEHELGHALGFDHDPSTYGQQGYFLTMAPKAHSNDKSNLDLTIGAKEQYALENYYDLSVMPGYNVYPVVNMNVKSLNPSDSNQNKVLDFGN